MTKSGQAATGRGPSIFVIEAPSNCATKRIVNTVVQAAETLAEGPFLMLGHSFGGLVALRMAARSPKCVGLALLAPAGLRAHQAVRRLGLQVALKALGASRVSRESFYRGMARTPIGAHASREDSDLTLALLASLDYAPSRAAARSLKVPVFCASCLDGQIVGAAVIDELLAALNTKRHLTFTRGGHSPQKVHAPEIGAALVEFVNALA